MQSTNAVVATDRNINQLRQDLGKLLTDLEAGQKEMEAGPLSQARGEELDRKADEAMQIQTAIEAYDRRAELIRAGRAVVAPTMPADDAERKSDRRVRATPGHLFVASDAFKNYVANGKAGWSGAVQVKSLRGRSVTLAGDDAEAFVRAMAERKEFDAATLPDIASDTLIAVQRDPEIMRSEEPEQLTIRDLLRTLPTSSDTVAFVTYEYSRAAASQEGRGAPKPYATVKTERATTSVQTIAVMHKIAEQDIEDAPRLVEIINTEMRLDVKVEEERQLLWGSGSDGELLGLFTAGLPEFDRSQAGDTLIDLIRRMRTDIRLARLAPSGVVVHPIDWEAIELAKGSDERYVWAVIQTELGPRIWSMPVVESMAMEDPSTGDRRMIVADWLRGATLYDRHDVRIAVGYVNDDFERNLRTLRAEERLAVALKRPAAFSWATTAEGGS